jgi:ribosomal protein L16/L10AE
VIQSREIEAVEGQVARHVKLFREAEVWREVCCKVCIGQKFD